MVSKWKAMGLNLILIYIYAKQIWRFKFHALLNVNLSHDKSCFNIMGVQKTQIIHVFPSLQKVVYFHKCTD